MKVKIQIPGVPAWIEDLGEVFSVGRSRSNTLSLQDDLNASRNHAIIARKDGGHFFLTDLGSTNGTLLNGSRIVTPVRLKPSDVIEIGSARIELASVDEDTATEETMREETVRVFRRQSVCLWVSDIRAYTRFAEVVPDERLSGLLHDWFKALADIVESHGGTVHQILGDALFAYFPETKDPAFTRAGVRAAAAAVEAARPFDDMVLREFPPLRFRIGVGVHCGTAVFGSLGKEGSRGFNAVGDCVNLTFRIESLCKELQRPILVSEDVWRQAREEFVFDDLGSQHVKGKEDGIRVFAFRAARPNNGMATIHACPPVSSDERPTTPAPRACLDGDTPPPDSARPAIPG